MYNISNFYKFTPLNPDNLEDIRATLTTIAKEHNLIGLMLIAPEGVNATIAGTKEAIERFEKATINITGPITAKYSTCEKAPFPRFKIKIKKEIVALKDPAVLPRPEAKRLSPQEWHAMMEDEDVVVLDTRNWYETDLGKFKNALDYRIEHFSDLPKVLEEKQIPKDKKVLMYCTGGIRCEKASTAMEKMGYKEVYELDGGILNYLEKMPNKDFEGECFVFDHRVAVRQDLSPSERYDLCPHCGQPGDIPKSCANCQTNIKVCAPCNTNHPQNICSKRCRIELAKAKETQQPVR